MEVRVVSSKEEFLDLGPKWQEVARRSNNCSAFATWEWAYTWLRHFGGRDRPYVIEVRDANAVLALVPLLRTTVGRPPVGFDMLIPIGSELADYTSFLLGEQAENAAAVIAEHLFQVTSSGIALHLTRLESDNAILPALRERFEASGRNRNFVTTNVATCHYLDIEDLADARAEIARRKKSSDVPRRTRRLADKHAISFEYHTAGNLERALDHVIDLHTQRWDTKRGTMQGLFSDEHGRAFARDVVRALGATDQARISLLSADGSPIAACLGFEVGGRYHLHKTGFDPEFARFAPKSVLIGDMMDAALDHGVQEFNFGRGETDYKLRWTNRSRDLTTVWSDGPRFVGRLQRSAASRVRGRRRRAPDRHGPWASLPALECGSR